MKIALLTIWHEKNYGAELQTYATIKTLTERGHNVVAIDYRLHYSKVNSIKSMIANRIESLMPANQHFESFWKKYIPSTRLYTSLDDLTNDPPNVECYLVGSDQVWNPDITGNKAITFFLPFVTDKRKKISYASSIGVNEWRCDVEFTKKVGALLSEFEALSCREETGATILEKIFRLHVSVVLDPTLLRKDFNELIGMYNCHKTLAFYQLYESAELAECAKLISHEMNLKFNDVNQSKRVGKIQVLRTGIKEWIKGIAESEFVITHSFHGMALSLLYHKQFMIIFNSKNNRSSRITDLLEKLGLLDRFFDDTSTAYKSRIWEKKIDFEIVENKLDKLRKESLDYLSIAGL